MDREFRSALRASVFVHAWLLGRRRWGASINVPDALFQELTTLPRLSDYALRHGWMFAAATLRRRLLRQVDHCIERMKTLKYELQEHTQDPLPTESELCSEIVALREEFDEVHVDLQKRRLSVTTESIRLDGIYLGRFKIELDCAQADRSAPYRVVALDPHPAAINSSVTHPHVQSEHLCEGDGRSAIRAALDSGRLTDFFLLINQLLCTYAVGSAFVEMSQWDGVPCRACGSTTDEDDSYYCEACEETVCGDCSHSCKHCDCNLCAGCLESCSLCEGDSCSSCLAACKSCGARCCPECLEEGTCTNCLEEGHDDSGEAQTSDPETSPANVAWQSAGASVQSDGMGQAAVSAGGGRE